MKRPTWFTGKVEKMNPERGTGIIKQYDGQDILFNIDDFIEKDDIAILQQADDKAVFYSLEQTEIGPKARKITVLKDQRSAL